MESSVKLLGHPAHQMLVMVPVGLLVTSVVFDAAYHLADSPLMASSAYHVIVVGILGGLLAAPFGLLDWMKIPTGTRARRVGALHGLGNVVVLALFGASAVMRMDAPQSPEGLAQVLSLAGVLLAGVTAWLGGELVDRLGVGVSDGAGLNAPSSLRGDARPQPSTAGGR